MREETQKGPLFCGVLFLLILYIFNLFCFFLTLFFLFSLSQMLWLWHLPFTTPWEVWWLTQTRAFKARRIKRKSIFFHDLFFLNKPPLKRSKLSHERDIAADWHTSTHARTHSLYSFCVPLMRKWLPPAPLLSGGLFICVFKCISLRCNERQDTFNF